MGPTLSSFYRVGQLVDSRSNTILSQIVESLFASQIVESNCCILKVLSATIFNQIVASIYQYNYCTCSQIVGLVLICSKKLHFFFSWEYNSIFYFSRHSLVHYFPHMRTSLMAGCNYNLFSELRLMYSTNLTLW